VNVFGDTGYVMVDMLCNSGDMVVDMLNDSSNPRDC